MAPAALAGCCPRAGRWTATRRCVMSEAAPRRGEGLPLPVLHLATWLRPPTSRLPTAQSSSRADERGVAQVGCARAGGEARRLPHPLQALVDGGAAFPARSAQAASR